LIVVNQKGFHSDNIATTDAQKLGVLSINEEEEEERKM
jgi:hypothetical protein